MPTLSALAAGVQLTILYVDIVYDINTSSIWPTAGSSPSVALAVVSMVTQLQSSQYSGRTQSPDRCSGVIQRFTYSSLWYFWITQCSAATNYNTGLLLWLSYSFDAEQDE